MAAFQLIHSSYWNFSSAFKIVLYVHSISYSSDLTATDDFQSSQVKIPKNENEIIPDKLKEHFDFAEMTNLKITNHGKYMNTNAVTQVTVHDLDSMFSAQTFLVTWTCNVTRLCRVPEL